MYVVTGLHPFDSSGRSSDLQMIREIRQAEFDRTNSGWMSISKDAQDLIRRLLTRDPATRLSVDQVIAHPWFARAAEATDRDNTDSLEQISGRSQRIRRFNRRCGASLLLRQSAGRPCVRSSIRSCVRSPILRRRGQCHVRFTGWSQS